VAEVNSDLTDAPQMINEDPYGQRLDLCRGDGRGRRASTGLMDAAAYQAFSR